MTVSGPFEKVDRPKASSARVALWWLIFGVAAAKLTILAVVGPSTTLDTGLYVAFADRILGGGLFAAVAFVSNPIPGTIFRTAGYPLILAGAKVVAPGFWAPLVVILQSALDIAAMALMFRVAERLFHSWRWAVAATLVYACSRSLLWDNALMSDSVYASLFNIVIFALLGKLLGCWRLSSLKLAGLAVLWGYSLWTRDNGLYFSFLPVVLLLACTIRRPFDWRRLGAPIGFAAIVAAMIAGYCFYNLQRTGDAFFSLTGVENYLRPLFDMRAYGYADPFAGDDLIDRTVRETMTVYDFPAQQRFITTLGERCGCTPTRLQSMVVAKFVDGVAHHPLAYLRVIARNFDFFDLASDLVDPINTFNDFMQEGTPVAARVVPGLSLRHLALVGEYSPPTIALMIVAGITKLLSAVMFTLFVFGIPFLWLRDWRRGGPIGAELWGVGFLWFAFAGVTAAFSLVHFEARHALPVFPAAQIGIVYMLAVMAERLGHRGLPQVKIELKP
jgi:hypothetical protein